MSTPEEVTEAVPSVVDPNYDPKEWVKVVLKGEKNMPPGLMSREYFDGWGKDKGWQEVK